MDNLVNLSGRVAVGVTAQERTKLQNKFETNKCVSLS
jgi:hypothetical protein